MGIFDLMPTRQQVDVSQLSVDEQIVHAIRQVYDPEVPVSIYEMVLIYGIHRNEDNNQVTVDMTLTTPNCPVAQDLPIEVQNAVESVPDVTGCDVEIVWDPPWNPEMMSEEAKLELGFI